eukprot:g1369.t1
MAPLSREAVEANLSGLARSPSTLSHVFTDLAVPDSDISEITVLREFPNVQNLNLQGNQIADLKTLAELPNLLTLNASKNALTTVLDYTTPHCREGDAWYTGDLRVGSTLLNANLSDNKIGVMRDLSWHRFLRTLVLDGNQIKTIKGIDTLSCLQVLSIKNNDVMSITGLGNLPIHSLHLDNNRIKHIKNLDALPRLKHLTISNNQIKNIAGLRRCKELQTIDLSDNLIEAVRQMEFLMDLPMLCNLMLSGNAVQRKDFYRRRVLVRLPRLTMLDEAIVSAEECVKAANLHGADVEARVEVFKKYLPNEEFKNYCPPFEEDEPDPQVEDEAETVTEEDLAEMKEDAFHEVVEDVVDGIVDTSVEAIAADASNAPGTWV